MCNFIIRPVKAYATVDIEVTDSENDIKAGEAVTVKNINVNSEVIVVRANDAVATVPMETYIHAFSLNDPNKKEEKKDSKKS